MIDVKYLTFYHEKMSKIRPRIWSRNPIVVPLLKMKVVSIELDLSWIQDFQTQVGFSESLISEIGFLTLKVSHKPSGSISSGLMIMLNK